MQIRPGIVPMDATAPRLQIKLHEIAAESIVPCGDRYLIEVVDFDEAFQLGQLLVLTKDMQINLKDPKADPMVEPRGVIGGVVLAVGNGHLLGIPDHAIVEYHQLGDDGEEPALIRPPANVPMFHSLGDLILVDHNAKGRNLKLRGREIRIVGQIDVLANLTLKNPALKFFRNESGVLEQSQK